MFKSSILWLHKWLGILSGIIVVVLSLSGAVYTFQDELKPYFYPEKYFYTNDSTGTMVKPLTELITIANAQLPRNEKISRVDISPAAGRSWVFRASKTDNDALGYDNYYLYYKRVFLNPYNGQVLAVENTKYEFFHLVLQLHMNLLLGKRYGGPLVGYGTAIFVILLLSGVVLWWPKKWAGKPLKRSLWLDRKVKWKRFNYDLHNVLGFYSFGIAIILCVTGLVYSFPTFKIGYTNFFNMFATSNTATNEKPHKSEWLPVIYPRPIDNVVHYALTQYPNADLMSVRLRDEDSEQLDVQIRLEEGRSGVFRWYYINKDDLHIDKVTKSEQLKGGDRLAALNFDIHTGSVGGMGTKIIAFFICLFCASLPITGYVLWWNKRIKKPKNLKKVPRYL